MKLLVVTASPVAPAGGAQRLARELAHTLATAHGMDVVLATGCGAAGEDAPCLVHPGPPREVRLRLACPAEQDERRRSGVAFAAAGVHGLEELADDMRPEVVLYTPHYGPCAVQAAALATRWHVPFALIPAIHLNDPGHTSRAARAFYCSATLVVSLSDVESAWLTGRAGVASERVVTLGCGWNGAVARQPRLAPRTRPLRLLTVGGYARHKQLDHQIEAVALLRHAFHVDAHLTIAGAPREGYVFDDLVALARRRRVDDAVQFQPGCSDAALAALYHDSDYFLFTSRSESFGIAVLDAIGAGTLPIVYPHPVYGRLVESSGFGILTRRATPKALAEAVVRVLQAPPADDRDDGRRRWLAERSWGTVTAPLADRLKQITAPDAVCRLGTRSHPGAA